VHADNFTGNRQAEPGTAHPAAAAGFIDLVKPLKNSGQIFGGYPWPLIHEPGHNRPAFEGR
jgi:hypothetical protein